MSENEIMLGLSGGMEHSRSANDEVIAGYSQVSPIVKDELSPMLSGVRAARETLIEIQRRVDAVLAEMAARWSGQ